VDAGIDSHCIILHFPRVDDILVHSLWCFMYHKDRKKYERIARARGLTMASYARMVLLEWMKADEA
jgi:hypothetical protein